MLTTKFVSYAIKKKALRITYFNYVRSLSDN